MRLLAALLIALGSLRGVPAVAADPAPATVDYVDELNFYNTDLHLVLKALAERTGYPFIEDIPVEGKVTIHISKRTTIAEVLDQLLRGLNLAYRLDKGVYHVQIKPPVKGQPLGRGLQARTYALDVVAADEAAEAVRPTLSEFGKLTVDPGMNTVTVTDVVEVQEAVRSLIESLDVEGKRPGQVNIQIKILEITRNDSAQVGADLAWHKYDAAEALGGNFLGDLNNVKGWGPFSDGGTQQNDEYFAFYPQAATFKVGHYGIDPIVMKILATSGLTKINVLSEPDVTVLDKKDAYIQIGDKITQKQSGGSISYKDTGIILKVKPTIGQDGLINLELNPKITDPESERVSGFPLMNTREVDTKVDVISGSTVRISGLLSSSNRKSEWKIPVIGDLPLLGYFFKYSTTTALKKELVILVSPHLVEHIPPRCATTAGISALAANLIVGTTDMLLDWSEDVPFDNIGVVRYHVYRDIRPIMGIANLIPLSREVRGDLTSWVDFTPKRRGVTYYYAVSAVDGAGNEQTVSNSPSVTVPRR